MSLSVHQVRAALAHAMSCYGHPKMGQVWLKPTMVLLLDALVPALMLPPGPTPFISMNSMKKEKWRKEVSEKCLQNLEPYHYECMVDLNVMRGQQDPFQILLTAESEGYAGHAQPLYSDTNFSDSGFMWDLYKLLHVPSPIRFFVTRSSRKHHNILEQRTDQLLNLYAATVCAAEIWAIQFPTASTKKVPVRILNWSMGHYAEGPSRSEWRFGERLQHLEKSANGA